MQPHQPFVTILRGHGSAYALTLSSPWLEGCGAFGSQNVELGSPLGIEWLQMHLPPEVPYRANPQFYNGLLSGDEMEVLSTIHQITDKTRNLRAIDCFSNLMIVRTMRSWDDNDIAAICDRVGWQYRATVDVSNLARPDQLDIAFWPHLTPYSMGQLMTYLSS